MKLVPLAVFMIIISHFTKAQIVANYDKTLNQAEIHFLDSLFKDSVQFGDKMVAFVHQDYQTFLTDKHHFFSTVAEGHSLIYRLMHLNESEKRQSGGYDVIVVYQTDEGKKPKANRPDRALVVDWFGRRQYYHTRDLAMRYYPDNLTQLGIDSSALLTAAESDYFNKVFQWEHKDVDFTNKKVAFFSGIAGDKMRSKVVYFDYRKHSLSNGWYQGRGWLVELNDEQKKESGIDYMIVYLAKIYNMDKMMALVTGKPYTNRRKM